MITYSPQRMLRHFDYDQGTAWMAGGTVSMSRRQNPAMWEMTESAYRGFPLALLAQPGQRKSLITWDCTPLDEVHRGFHQFCRPE